MYEPQYLNTKEQRDKIRTTRDSEDAKIVVLDTGIFLSHKTLDSLDYNIEYYTTSQVLEEVKDKISKEYIQNFPWKLNIMNPTADILVEVGTLCKKFVGLNFLSSTDISVIAITYALYIEQYGERPISPKSTFHANRYIDTTSNDTINLNLQPIKGYFTLESYINGTIDSTVDDAILPEINIDELNLNDELNDTKKYIEPEKILDTKTGVKCMTGDYTMQNMLIRLGLQVLLYDDTLRINRLYNWVMQCYTCKTSTDDMSKKFCPLCGGQTMVRANSITNSEGEIKYKYNRTKVENQRHLNLNIPRPKGGMYLFSTYILFIYYIYIYMYIHTNRKESRRSFIT